MKSHNEKLIRLRMVRPNLEALPEFELPAPFTMRLYRQGDLKHWIRIVNGADLHQEISVQQHWKAFNLDTRALTERQFFLCDSTRSPVGTATAWYDANRPDEVWGWIHYVAILPEYQGQGLSKPLLAIVCARLRDLGHTQAFLNTESVRVPAINLYLRFGFKPLPRDDAEETAWRALVEDGAIPRG